MSPKVWQFREIWVGREKFKAVEVARLSNSLIPGCGQGFKEGVDKADPSLCQLSVKAPS